MKMEVFVTVSLSLAGLLTFLAGAASAQDWTGYIVDAKCYVSQEQNRNPTDTDSYANSDVGYEIRVCHPTPKSKTFVFIEQNGLRYFIDPAGNGRVFDFVHANGKKAADLVSVVGTKSPGYHMQLQSIALAP